MQNECDSVKKALESVTNQGRETTKHDIVFGSPILLPNIDKEFNLSQLLDKSKMCSVNIYLFLIFIKEVIFIFFYYR